MVSPKSLLIMLLINFSRIALYGEQAKSYIFENHSVPVDLITNSSGWFDSGDESGNEQSQKLGRAGAEAHSAGTDVNSYDQNLQYWETLIPLLQKKNITNDLL